jgi:hypothetical protein
MVWRVKQTEEGDNDIVIHRCLSVAEPNPGISIQENHPLLGGCECLAVQAPGHVNVEHFVAERLKNLVNRYRHHGRLS